MLSDFPYGKEFELGCLALLVQEPHDSAGIIEPRNFTDTSFVDIAGAVKDAYAGKDLSTFRLKFRSLWPFVVDKARLDTARKSGLKPHYKQVVRRIFNIDLPDKGALLAKVSEWSRDQRAREALIAIEKEIHAKRPDRALEQSKELVTILGAGASPAGDKGEAIEPRIVDFPCPSAPPHVDRSRWFIDNLIAANGLTMGVGVPESGKSLLALLMFDCGMRGFPFLGHASSSRRSVFALYVDTENGLAEMLRRCEAFSVITPQLRFWCLDNNTLGPPPKDPLDPRYVQFAKKYRCPMVFDSLQYFTDGKINNPEDVAPVLQKFKLLAAQWRIPIYVLHHSSDKDPRNIYLGSTLIRATLDAGHFIVAKKDPTDRDLRYITLTSIKSRRGGDITLAVQINWRTGEYEEWQSPIEGLRKKLEAILERNPKISERKLEAKLGVSRWKIRKLLGKK